MPSEIKAYNMVIIGGGPAGIVGAATAKACRKTVALVDSHSELGGAGVNTGTVPSKTLRETALVLSGIKARKLVGVDLALKHETTIADFLRYEQHVKEGCNTMILQQLKADQETEIVHIGLMALPAGSTADVFIEACFNAPTLGALNKSATIDATLSAAGSAASLTALAEA
jgi:Pyridine nucleotide-disulphide oxidoreductase